MPALDYRGARQRLYVARQLRHAADGYLPGPFIGVFRAYTIEAAMLEAMVDVPAAFRDGPCLVTDLSAWLRMAAAEIGACAWILVRSDGTMERGSWDLATVPTSYRTIRVA